MYRAEEKKGRAPTLLAWHPEPAAALRRALPARLRLLGRSLILTADRTAEITQPFAERPSDLRQPLRTQHYQRDHQDEQKVRGLEDVADHQRRG